MREDLLLSKTLDFKEKKQGDHIITHEDFDDE
jgi:hypothetical protein